MTSPLTLPYPYTATLVTARLPSYCGRSPRGGGGGALDGGRCRIG